MPIMLPKVWGAVLAAACLVVGCALPAPTQPVNQPTRPGSAPPPSVQAVLLPTVTPEGAQAGTDLNNRLTPEQQALLATLKNRGPAPELANTTWFNSAPLQLADLRGKVVMIEFWTFG